MSREHGRPPERDAEAYWQEDVRVGEVAFQDERYPLWMRVHQAREAYREHRELVELEETTGERLYLHARPYVLVPDLRVTVALDEPATPPNGNGQKRPDARRIGQVLSSEQVGWRSRDLGNAQGWSYPDDRLIMLWECYLEDWCRGADPTSDPLLSQVWERFEERLVASLPEATSIATPSWENMYPRAEWQAFLGQQGYAPESPAVFSKRLDE